MQERSSINQVWLINPRSGNGQGAKLLHSLAGVPGVTAAPIDFQALGSQLAAIPLDALTVVAGGDGTFSAVLGQSEIGSRRVLCFPIGTANDLAREMGVSEFIRGRTTHQLPTLIASLPICPFAVWSVSADGKEYPCANYVSIGYEGAVVRDFSRWRAKTRFSGKLINRLAYTLFGLKSLTYTVSGLSLRCDNLPPIPCPPTTGLIITNIQSHLGLGISNGESSPKDQQIECVSLPTVFGFLSMMMASSGFWRPPRTCARGTTIEINQIPEGTPLQIDGEAYPSVVGGKIRVTFRHFVSLCHAP